MEGTDRSKAATRSLQLRLLGAPRLILPEAEHALERRDAALLALLVIDGPTPRARAAALVWPDADDEHARNNLRQRLFRLNRLAGRDIVVPEGVLRLAPEVEHDLSTLSDRSAIDPEAGAGELLGQLDYADCSELADWIQLARERWRSARRDALAEAASRLEAEGQIAHALLYAERLVADDPLHEHAHRRLMRLHYLRGDRSAALAAFERCREVLERELGTSPGRETSEIAALIESSSRLPGSKVSLAGPTPLAVLRPPRLVGRDSEWQEIEAAWRARVVIVCGEPGIGKTRLLTDFAGTQSRAAMFGARPGDSRVPYALLARLLRGLAESRGIPQEDWVRAEFARLLPELGAAPAGPLEPLRLRQAVTNAFTLWSGGSDDLLVVDDLHFADEASLELLSDLAIGGQTRGGWLFGVRSGEVPAVVDAWLAPDPENNAPLRLDLGPLRVAAIEGLLASLAIPGLDAAALAEPLARHTGGNPMFILETLRSLLVQGAGIGSGSRLPAPSSIGQLIKRRLAQLSPPALKLARVAALAGQDFSVELAAEVLRQHPLDLAEGWRELEAAQVIRDNAFAHDLILEGTLRSVPEPIAQVLHRDVAAFLEAHGAPPARVAQHWYQASEWEKAGAAYVAAARLAFKASRRLEEVGYWELACECFQRSGLHAEAFKARCDSVDSLLNAASVDRARAVSDALLAESRTDDERLAALIAHVNVLLMSVKVEAAVAAAREALELARGLGARWHEYDAARLLAIGLSQAQRAAEAADLLEPYRGLVEREGDREKRYQYWSDMAYVLQGANRRRQCVQALSRAIRFAEEMGDLAQARTCTCNLAGALSDLGRVDEALTQADRALRLRERLGDTQSALSGALDSQVGLLYTAVGRYREALQHFDAALECFRGADHATWRTIVQNHKADTLLVLGQPGRALKAIDQTDETVLTTTRARSLIVGARIERALGRPGTPKLRQAVELLGERGDPYMRVLAELDATRAQSGPEAVDQCTTLLARAERLERFGVAIKARFLRADCLLRAGEVGRSRDEIDAALSMLEKTQPWDMYLPEVWWIAYQVFDANDDKPAAVGALRLAITWINDAALPQVPDEYCDSFLHRNPVNRALLTTASRRLGL